MIKYMTKIEFLLEDEDFMKVSKDVHSKIQKCKEKRGEKFGRSDEWRIVNNQIKKKLSNSITTKGICVCPDNILCDHRKKYLKEAMNE